MTIWGNVILPQKDGFIYGTAEPAVSGLWFKSDGADVPADPDVGNGLFYYRDNDGQLHPLYPMSRMQDVYGLAGKLEDIDKSHNALNDRVGGMIAGKTIEIQAGSWGSGQATVAAPGVTAGNTVIVSYAEESYASYTESGIRCTGQGEGTLTFVCESTPDVAVGVNVVILN